MKSQPLKRFLKGAVALLVAMSTVKFSFSQPYYMVIIVSTNPAPEPVARFCEHNNRNIARPRNYALGIVEKGIRLEIYGLHENYDRDRFREMYKPASAWSSRTRTAKMKKWPPRWTRKVQINFHLKCNVSPQPLTLHCSECWDDCSIVKMSKLLPSILWLTFPKSNLNGFMNLLLLGN